MPDYVNKDCGYIDEETDINIEGGDTLTFKPCFFYDTKSFEDAFNNKISPDHNIEYDPTTKKYKNTGVNFRFTTTTDLAKDFLGYPTQTPWGSDTLATNPTILPEGRHTTPKIMSCPDSTAVSDHTSDLIEKRVRKHSSLHTMKKMTLAIQCSNENYNNKKNNKKNKHASKDDAYARYLAKRKHLPDTIC